MHDEFRDEGTPEQEFALMVHDRVVALENALTVAPVDPRVTVLGSRGVADSGAVFVRLVCHGTEDLGRGGDGGDGDGDGVDGGGDGGDGYGDGVDGGGDGAEGLGRGDGGGNGGPRDGVWEWCARALRRLGARDPTRYDAWACRHWRVGADRLVVEALFEKSAAPLDVRDVANAAVAGCAPHVVAEACAVTNPAWFLECIRATGNTGDITRTDDATRAGGTTRARAHASGTRDDRQSSEVVCAVLDPSDMSVLRSVVDPPPPVVSDKAFDKAAWVMLNGWLASVTEITELAHPRSHCAHRQATKLARALAHVIA